MNIGLDIDGVLRNFCGSLVKVYKEDFPGHEVKPITTWYFHESFPIGKLIYEYYKKNALRIFCFAEAYEGASEFTEKLKSLNHNITLVTTQPQGSEIYTLSWIKDNLIKYDSIAFTDSKSLLNCDIFLDDAPHNLEALRKAEKRAVAFTQKWNEHIEGERVSSYKEFIGLLQ